MMNYATFLKRYNFSLRQIHKSVSAAFPQCELTSKRYPVTRGKFSILEDKDIKFFETFLDSHQILTSEADLEAYNTDWLGIVRGYSRILLKPRSTHQVAEILKYCNVKKLAVCPQGGNTGLVGGSVPVFDEVIVSTSLMNKIDNLDTLSGVVICQAGCILETLDNYVAEYDLIIPLDLGAKGSCHIGGNVSTNAGGLRFLRYGSLHGSILGVEVVLASGEIIDCLSSLKKDNTGYDLKHLFIGSEGTLGFVAKVAIQCQPKPKSVYLIFLGLDDFECVLKIYQNARSKLGEILSSCEFIDEESMESVKTNLKLKPPFDGHKFYMLIETSGSNGKHDEEKLNAFLDDILNSGIAADGTVATDSTRIKQIWAIRENIAESLLYDGYVYKYDISVPLPYFYKLGEDMKKSITENVIRICSYGHIGDGNVHFNITSPDFNKALLNEIEPLIFEKTALVKGSISAEHGLGFKKRNFIHYSKSENVVQLMKKLKTVLDPNGILNPYKVLPD